MNRRRGVGRRGEGLQVATALPVCRVNLPIRASEARKRSAATMLQVSDWLEKLGLGQYAQRFAENDIDAFVLPHLTDQTSPLGID
jgi:hypothetical protein